jgi:uncharacterized protein
MKRRSLLATLPALGLGLAADRAWTQTPSKPMVVSTGATSATYYRLMKEFDEAAPGLIVNMESDGSLTNIDRIMGNLAELGITQLDALNLRAMKEVNLKERIRVLLPLHLEEIHFLAKSAAKTEGGLGAFGISTGINAKTIYLNTFDDLRGRRIGFWGGAVITEQNIASMTLIGWAPVEFPDQRTALDALKADQVDALMAVGGQPLAWVGELSRDYKLLSVSDPMARRMDQSYEKTTLTYRNLGQEGVQALAVRAMLVTRVYTSRTKRDQLQTIHDRLAEVVADIRETRGTHPKWADIDPAGTTDKWPMYFGTKQ